MRPLVPDLAVKGPPFRWNGPYGPLLRPLWSLKKAPLVTYLAPLVPYVAKDPYRPFTPDLPLSVLIFYYYCNDILISILNKTYLVLLIMCIFMFWGDAFH